MKKRVVGVAAGRAPSPPPPARDGPNASCGRLSRRACAQRGGALTGTHAWAASSPAREKEEGRRQRTSKREGCAGARAGRSAATAAAVSGLEGERM